MKPKITERVAYILHACRGRRVLHVGCADAPYTESALDNGTLLHAIIDKVAAALYGIDASAEGIELLKKRGYKNLAVVDVEHMGMDNPFTEVRFDVVIAGEIIEHLSNPGLFLDNTRKILRDGSTRLVLTTVNAYCAHRFLYTLLTGKEGVHPDHVSYFSRSTLIRLLTKYGYEVEDFSFYNAQESKDSLNRGRGRILWWVDRFTNLFHPALGDGVIATCRLSNAWDPDESLGA